MDNLQRKEDDIRFKDLVIQYREGNKDSLTELVELCEPMVEHMSRKYYNLAMLKNIPIEDLKQECYIGLLGAVAHFPVDVENNSFTSFAFSSMNYQMLIYIRNNSNRIVKSDWTKGSIETESMDKEQCSFGELKDPFQERAFEEVENDIDRQIQKKAVYQMLNDILHSESDVQLLKDMYGLDGQTYSLNELCNRHNITLKQLIFKERLMILKIRNNRKLQKYIEKLDYCSQAAYKYGVQRFKDSRVSSTEFIALQHIEYQEKLDKYFS